MNIDFSKKLYDLVKEQESLRDFLVSIGFDKLNNPIMFNTMAKMITLENVLKTRGIEKEVFLKRYTDFLSVNKENYIEDSLSLREKSDITIEGVLPCPVKDPILEGLNLKINEIGLNVYTDLRSANLGLSFIDERNGFEELPDILITAGYEFPFFNKKAKEYLEKGLFSDGSEIVGKTEFNKVFKNMKDPKSNIHLLGAVPCVMLFNKTIKGKKEVEKWSDLFEKDFVNSLSIPLGDLDMFNASLLTIDKFYGEKGIIGLQEAFKKNMHPSQMVKMALKKEEATLINVIPYFFGEMAKRPGLIDLIWPEEGAIMSPIFAIYKKEKLEKLKPIIEYLYSKEFAFSMYANGKFPSTNIDVENNLEGKKLLFAGWDYIYNNDLGEKISIMERKFR